MDNKVISLIVGLGLLVGFSALTMSSSYNNNQSTYRPYGGTFRIKKRTQNKSKRK